MAESRRPRPILVGWIPAIAWALLMVMVSSIPNIRLPRELEFPLIDKVAHLFEYTIFGFLLAKSFRLHWREWTRHLPAVAAVGVLFALADEYHQRLVPGRFFEVIDLAADGLGLVLGWLFLQIRPLRGSRAFGWIYRPWGRSERGE
jgi:VanZ family protein